MPSTRAKHKTAVITPPTSENLLGQAQPEVAEKFFPSVPKALTENRMMGAQRQKLVMRTAQVHGNRNLQNILARYQIQREAKVGWNSRNGRLLKDGPNSGERNIPVDSKKAELGSSRRIPVSGLKTGNQDEDTNVKTGHKTGPKDDRKLIMVAGHPEQIGDLTGESSAGEAIVVIPDNLSLKDPVEVLLHLHGHSIGYRSPGGGGEGRDVAKDFIEQQLRASGLNMIGILPQGGYFSGFEGVDRQAYVQEIFDFLNKQNLWQPGKKIEKEIKPGPLTMSSWSGGSNRLSSLLGYDAAGRKPANPNPTGMKGLIIFDSFHGEGTFVPWLQAQWNNDLKQLLLISQGAGGETDKADEAQLAYLENSMRFRGYYTEGYAKRYQILIDARTEWFNATKKSSVPKLMSEKVYDKLADNYQITPAAKGTEHEQIIGKHLQDGLKMYSPKSAKQAQPATDGVKSQPRTDVARTLMPTPSISRASDSVGLTTNHPIQRDKAKGKVAKKESVTLAPAGDSHTLDKGVEGYTTDQGFFRRYPVSSATKHTNTTDRPQFRLDPAEITGNFHGNSVHPAVVDPLTALMDALHQAGDQLDDASLKLAKVGSAFRTIEAEGSLYLGALQKTIRKNPTIFGTLTFPTDLETLAKSDMQQQVQKQAFKDALAASPGWNASLAERLVSITGQFKAAAGGSTHHSGVVVDINFPYIHVDGDKLSVEWHGMSREKNAEALQSAAGVWLSQSATTYKFDTYDTDKEIWHQEWRAWSGPLAKARRI